MTTQNFFSDNIFAAVYQPQANNGAGQYLMDFINSPLNLSSSAPPPVDTFHLGQGYWVYAIQPTPLLGPTATTAPTGPYSISRQKGWNQIGDPFVSSVPLSMLSINDSSGSTPLTMAMTAKMVSPLYGYNTSTMGYVTLTSPTQTIEPGVGEWINVSNPETLVVTPPAVPEFTVTGRVVSSVSGGPVPITVAGLPGGPRNFTSGGIRIPSVPNGLYTVSIASGGYIGKITLAQVKDANVDLGLIHLDSTTTAAGRLQRTSRQASNVPTITSAVFSPAAGNASANLLITGSNFAATPTVTIQAVPGSQAAGILTQGQMVDPASVTLNSSSSLTVSITGALLSQLTQLEPFVGATDLPSLVTQLQVVVTNPNSAQPSNAVIITTTGSNLATITSITYSPPGGPDNNNPGPQLTINGTNLTPFGGATLYGPGTGGGAIRFHIYQKDLVLVSSPDTQLMANLANPLDPGDYTFTMYRPDGTLAGTQTFTVAPLTTSKFTPPPGFQITSSLFTQVSDSPTPIPSLDSATYDGTSTITIAGSNFVSGTVLSLIPDGSGATTPPPLCPYLMARRRLRCPSPWRPPVR